MRIYIGLLSEFRSESWASAAAASELFDLKAVKSQYSDYVSCGSFENTHADGTWGISLANSLA
jgi:hypothetical protein